MKRFVRSELSPLDGRYARYTDNMRAVCSERGLVKNRIEVEWKYLLALVETLVSVEGSGVTAANRSALQREAMIRSLDTEQLIDRVFELEVETRHDVKAVELALAERLRAHHPWAVPFIHFGLTSQDVNGPALWMQLRSARGLLQRDLASISDLLHRRFFVPYQELPMLARTHGQPATPTLLGKEMMVFVERLRRQTDGLMAIACTTKFGGATGGFNAHHLAYPTVNWPAWADDFLESKLGFASRQQYTTQIEHYDGVAELCDAVKRCNTIIIDLCRDMWQYISLGYFRQPGHTQRNSTGSSTMPHKVNPINFECAEGNLMISSSLLDFMASKLPVSRLQRDLTDSTVSRNIGVALGYATLGYQKALDGLRGVAVNRDRLAGDLSEHWEVVTEGIQTLLRRDGVPNAYEEVKHSVNKQIEKHGRVTAKGTAEFASDLADSETLSLEETTIYRIKSISPGNYKAVLPSFEHELEVCESNEFSV